MESKIRTLFLMTTRYVGLACCIFGAYAYIEPVSSKCVTAELDPIWLSGEDLQRSYERYLYETITYQQERMECDVISDYSEESGNVLMSDTKSVSSIIQNLKSNMIFIEGGSFQMGESASTGGLENPLHWVTLSPFYIGRFEVTNEEWEALMGRIPSKFDDPKDPVENVSWYDCQEFIRKLNSLTGKKFRLPSEAEWEYAARGGRKSNGYKYSGSNNPESVAWYSYYFTSVVGKKSPNELGLYDMSGNVSEWCNDWYDEDYYSRSPKRNPHGPSSGEYKIIRGGDWYGDGKSCGVSFRSCDRPSKTASYHGFRLALSQW